MIFSYQRFQFIVIAQVQFAIANYPVLHSKTKHIEIRYHFIRDHVMNGEVELHFIPTEFQLADLFTKPLDESRFNMLISELGMLNIKK